MGKTLGGLTSGEHDEYIFKTGDQELLRLGFQHRAWGAPTYALWERAGFAPGRRILDLGSGPGYCTLDLAHLVGPTGSVVAVDASERFLKILRDRMASEPVDNVETIESDVNALSLPPASLDGAYARWLLCFLPDPLNVIRRVAAALKPGATFAIHDYSDYLGVNVLPRSAAFRRAFEAVTEAWRAHGGDPNVASRLPELLVEAGFTIREATPLVRSARPGTSLWEWPTIFFRMHIPVLVQEGYLTQAESDEFFRDWDARSNNPNAVFLTPPMLEIVAQRSR